MIDADPRLEIFIPYWGDPGLLRATVDSVRAQTDPRWTLVVVDDCYPDPSVAESFARERDPRIRYQRNAENLGIVGNFQRCLDLALVLDMVTDGSSLLLDPVVTFDYRRHDSSLSGAALSDGSRFEQDRRYFTGAAAQMRGIGWRRAEREARLRWTSRLHALTLLPDALRSPDDRSGALRQVVRHAVAR